MLDAALCQTLLRAGMHRKNDRHFGGNGVDRSEKLTELFCRIDIGRAMEGQDTKALPSGTILQGQFLTDCGPLGDGQKVAQRIDHYVAHHENAAAGPAFFEEVLDGVFFRDKEVVGECIG